MTLVHLRLTISGLMCILSLEERQGQGPFTPRLRGLKLDRLRYEIKLMGKRVILTPILVMVGFTLFALLLHYLKVIPARFLSGGLEMILPLSAGVIVATITSQDPAIELQLTTPKKYHRTAMGRLALIALWSALITLLSSAIITAIKLAFMPTQLLAWSEPMQFIANQLTWFSPLLWFVGMGLCLAMLTRSRSASGAILSGIWLVEIVFKDFFAGTTWLQPVYLFTTTLTPAASFWLTNRIEVLVVGLILLPLGWLLLRNPEGLLKGSSEE